MKTGTDLTLGEVVYMAIIYHIVQREILFVLLKNLSTRDHFQCERFFRPTKIFASATKLHRCHRLALEAYNFLPGEEIYCSLTDTLQRVIICRKWYQENGIMYVTPFPPFRDGSKCLQKKVQGSYAGACGFQTRILQARKCPIRVKTTAASTSVEQLSLSLHAP